MRALPLAFDDGTLRFLGATPRGYTRDLWRAVRPDFTGLSRSHSIMAEREGFSSQIFPQLRKLQKTVPPHRSGGVYLDQVRSVTVRIDQRPCRMYQGDSLAANIDRPNLGNQGVTLNLVAGERYLRSSRQFSAEFMVSVA